MFHVIASILKLVLVVIALYLMYLNRNKKENRLYWMIAAVYWFVNFLSGIFK